MNNLRPLVVAFCLLPLLPVHAGESPPQTADAGVETAKATCEHGVQKKLCTRCNPKLAAVYKAKGDWCGEHSRPESQCAICNPELKRKGVKE